MDRKKILILITIFTVLVIAILIAFNFKVRYKQKFISEDKLNSITEARSVSSSLALEYIEFNDYRLIIDENSSTLYYSLVNDSKNKYNPTVSFRATDNGVKLAILSDEITDEKVKSDYKFKVIIYNDQEYRIYDLVCTDLPIVNIRYKEDAGSKQKNIPMQIYVFNNLSNTPNKVTVSNGKLKINEEGYTFALNMTTPGKNIRDNRISILNMKPNSQYTLTEVKNSDAESTQVAEAGSPPKSHRVALFINSEHRGVYSLGYAEMESKE